MKILLDTTFLLPTIGVSVKDIPQEALEGLVAQECEIVISEITLFELSAKGAKFVSKGMLLPEQVAEGIRAIVHDETIDKICPNETEILLTAMKLRCLMNDFVDCLILSTAINHCDALVTEDNEIHDLKKKKEYLELLSTSNPNFKIKRLSEAS